MDELGSILQVPRPNSMAADLVSPRGPHLDAVCACRPAWPCDADLVFSPTSVVERPGSNGCTSDVSVRKYKLATGFQREPRPEEDKFQWRKSAYRQRWPFRDSSVVEGDRQPCRADLADPDEIGASTSWSSRTSSTAAPRSSACRPHMTWSRSTTPTSSKAPRRHACPCALAETHCVATNRPGTTNRRNRNMAVAITVCRASEDAAMLVRSGTPALVVPGLATAFPTGY